MKVRRGLGIVLVGAGMVVLSCSADRGSAAVGADASVSAASAEAVVESSAAATRIAELRARFRLSVQAPEDDRPGVAHALPITRPALGTAMATRFEAAAGPDASTHVRAVLPADARRGVTRAAHVALPVRASGEVKLEDDTSHLSVSFTLEHVQDARIEVAGGMALYRGALDGGDVVHRVHAEGTEDFVVFETRPAREELSYAVDVSRVPGLRLVSNTLEFLDETGTPVLRVAPPFVVDAKGERHDAKLAVSGCAYDANPAGPWGRRVTSPGAARCIVRVAWVGSMVYPVMVDPVWGATGSMTTARSYHTASLLLTGKVLVAGGQGSPVFLASAELYDPGGNAGAGTFAATGSMGAARRQHTASVLPSGKVLMAGGAGSGGALASAELYDPAGNAGAGTFSATGPMATARYSQTASVLPSGKVLVAAGCSGVNCATRFASAELFDPAGNSALGSFGSTGSLAAARSSHAASVLPSGKVLVAGGYGGGELATAEVFDPAGNAGVGAFVATGSMASARDSITLTLLPSGKVLAAGGSGMSGPVGSAEVFDPAGNAGAGSFVATGSMAARLGHTASVLPSGKVLVTGGFGGVFLSSAELFDPAANSGAGAFAATGSMVAARRAHTATVLPSGKVLVAGGDTSGVAIASAEIVLGASREPCAANAYCLSGFCVDGLCCDSACGGGCDRCDVSGKEGTCSPASAGDLGANSACAAGYACDGVAAACPTSCASDTACAANYYCAPAGTCQPRKAQATACNAQTNCKTPDCRECSSGFCVDGFCCDTACNGTCQACAAALKYTGAADGTCDSAKEGLNRGGKICGPPGATCDGDHTTTASDGTKKDCAPYKCDNNANCLQTCTSVNDCVAPTICDPTGKCVPPAAAGSDGGCAVSAAGAGDESSRLAWLTAAAGLVLARRRRRRASKAGSIRTSG